MRNKRNKQKKAALQIQKENSEPASNHSSPPVSDEKPLKESLDVSADLDAEFQMMGFQYGREKKDYLDIKDEDFSKHFAPSIDGKQIVNPSTFNIFRDSLKATSEELHKKLLESLPNIDSGSEEDGVSSSDGEIVPLDFRTASINQGNDLIIQVKPLHYKNQVRKE